MNMLGRLCKWQGVFCRPQGVVTVLLLAVVLVYANSFPGTFILDDLAIVKGNPLVQHPQLLKIFRTDYWHEAVNSGLYRPLTILSLALDNYVLGADASGFHLVNVVLHAGVAILLWRLLTQWGMPSFASVVAALLFVAHPIHVEVVNIVVGRSELLVAFFLLAAFVVACGTGPVASLMVCGLYLLALLSKEHAIVFLAMLPLREYFASRSMQVWRERWQLYAGLAAVTVAWLFWREAAVVSALPRFVPSDDIVPLTVVNTQTRVLTALQYQALYLWKQLVPVNLQAYYAPGDLPAIISDLFTASGLLVAMATGLLLAALVYGWHRQWTLTLLGLLYMVSFAPTANIFLPIGVTFAERLAYFPSLWFCAAVGSLLAVGLADQRSQRWILCALVIYGFYLGGTCIRRNQDYSSSVALWQAEVADNPGDSFALISLAESYAESRQGEAAEKAFREALALAPGYHTGWLSRVNFLTLAGRYHEAREAAETALALAAAKGDRVGMAFDKYNLAGIYLVLGEPQQSLALLDLRDNPMNSHPGFLALRGKVLAALGNDAEAVNCFTRLDMTTWGRDIGYQYGQSLFNLGRGAEAVAPLERAARIYGNAPAWNLLGVVRAQQGNVPEALSAFQQAVELEPNNVPYRENLERAHQMMTNR